MDTMKIEFTREQRVLLWNVIGSEIFRLESKNTTNDSFINECVKEKVKALKVLEILIVG
jgi:hypothetical protein